MALRIFPVLGGASYTAEFYPVATETQRRHLGIDLFAPEGTPLIAVDDGEVRFGTDTLGGNVANLRASDGTRYYYAHLTGFEGTNRLVRAGDVIGYLGTTGNARGTSPHTHFEAHPGGGAAVDPYPELRAASVRQRGVALPNVSWLFPLVVAGALGGLAWWAFTEGPLKPRRAAASRVRTSPYRGLA